MPLITEFQLFINVVNEFNQGFSFDYSQICKNESWNEILNLVFRATIFGLFLALGHHIHVLLKPHILLHFGPSAIFRLLKGLTMIRAMFVILVTKQAKDRWPWSHCLKTTKKYRIWQFYISQYLKTDVTVLKTYFTVLKTYFTVLKRDVIKTEFTVL